MSVVQSLAAVQAQLQTNATGKRVRPKKFEMEMFHLGIILDNDGHKPARRRQTQKDMLSIIKMIAGASKAKVTKVGEGFNPALDLYGGPNPDYKG